MGPQPVQVVAAALPAAEGELAVIDHRERYAYAVPGRPGRIVVSRGLLRSLDTAQRRAVLDHERAHLTHRHRLQAIAQLAAAANPLVRRLPAAVGLSSERWVDESAAATCRRDIVADALTPHRQSGRHPAGAIDRPRRGRHRADHPDPGPAQPGTPLTLWRVALLIGLLVATAAAVVEAAQDTERLFDLAQAAYRSTPR